jgi:large subunit ribosomal protein L23
MSVLFNVLKAPILTEKALAYKESDRQVTLQVATTANKHQIRDAAQKLFGVSVVAVRTAVYRGKMKRVGKSAGRQAKWKKAMLTLAEGSNLEAFGSVASKE